MDPTSSQFVVVSLVRAGMVYGNKYLWELLVFKKVWSISQEKNWKLQKISNKKRKLEQMQKPTEVQLEEMIDDKMNSKIESTLPKEVRTILDRSFKSQSFVPHNYQRNSSSTNTNSNETRQSGMVSGEGKKRRKRTPKKSGIPATPAIMISPTANIATEPLENTEIHQNTSAVPSTQQDPTVPLGLFKYHLNPSEAIIVEEEEEGFLVIEVDVVDVVVQSLITSKSQVRTMLIVWKLLH